MMRLLAILVFVIQCSFAQEWREVDWSSDQKLPLLTGHRGNIYNLKPDELKEVRRRGMIHAVRWPVEVTGLFIPYRPFKNFLESDLHNPIKKWIAGLTKKKMGYQSLDEFYSWLGLHPFPEEGEGVFYFPYPDGHRPGYRMGASIIETPHGKGLTFSCVLCHSGEFLGKTVFGLPNKRPRANEFFDLARAYIPKLPPFLFKVGTEANREEERLYRRSRENIKSVGTVRPQVLGLDTSLAHTALSLAKRNLDPYATKSAYYQRRPRPNKLSRMIADSKPLPWWNLKYKTRWLADGSIISGNPVFTNFLWNEIGRGTDLRELEKWLQNNDQTIKELTTAVFASRAPKWTDFFPASSIDLEKAKRGETLFNKSCKKCHGKYIKGWSLFNADSLSDEELIATVKLKYHRKTKIKNVGTDPNRYLAMKEFASRLNDLAISKWMKTVVRPTNGYVPPPLLGIFLRYPYFHNNSIPNLCALMEKVEDRPKFWINGPSKSIDDYDSDCVGYPVGENIPREWFKDKSAYFRPNKPGLLNIGHEDAFYDKNGDAKFNSQEKKELLEFLKTL